MPVVSGYTQFGGAHAETASLTNVLAAAGVRNPHTGAPYSEALLLGIGGGLGAGYILWEFQEHQTKVLVLGFHNNWQYPTRYYQTLCDRIGVTIAMLETGSRKAAGEMLDKALANDRAAVAWVDRAHLPYLQLPEAMKGHIGHFAAICGVDGTDVLIDDRAAAPYRVPSDILVDARARIGSYENRLLLVESETPTDLVNAVNAGLHAFVDHLSSDSDSFSLPTLRKWGRMMTDEKHKKGWLTVFKDTRGLYGTLRSAFEAVELDNGGGGLRDVYATFLEEAAEVTGNDSLTESAQHYRDLAARWTRLAEAMLPDEVEPLRETKSLVRERHAVLMQGGDAWQTTKPITDQLRKMGSELNLDFPMDDAGIKRLFEAIQSHIWEVYEAEVTALAALKRRIGEARRFGDK